jgi:hypothetical protein
MPRSSYHQLVDAQTAMAFMVQQGAYIETEAYRIKYPDIQYQFLVPVDDSAPEWVKSITFYSIDHVGQAQWLHHQATDMRLADVARSAFEQGVGMAGIGYRYTLEEVGQAMLVGWNLTAERAIAAVRAYEEFVNKVAISGDKDKNWTGLINAAGVTIVPAPAGTGGTTWATKTADEIIADINSVLMGIYTASNTVEMADTILLPVAQFTLLSTKRLNDAIAMSVLEWIQKYNVYTQQTGAALTMRAVRELDGAGAPAGTGVDRMVAYRRDPQVLKMHIPMRHRFLPVWQTGPIVFDIPGIFRLGGCEIRRPGAVRYMDGI